VDKKLRLDTVVRLRETEEDRACRAMADAQRNVSQATQLWTAAQARASTDERNGASAAHWSIVECAHSRALQEARQAERAVQTASEGLSIKRTQYLGAHTKTQAIRKVLESRRTELARAEDRAERKIMDDIATLLFRATA
jgi:flagellar export protein FliJ